MFEVGSSLLACPLCSQPSFQSLDSLRYGLISAATRQVMCPVCHDILFGLDKFTIHLFSHSVHHHQEPQNGFPSQLSVVQNQTAKSTAVCPQKDKNCLLPKHIQNKPYSENGQILTVESSKPDGFSRSEGFNVDQFSSKESNTPLTCTQTQRNNFVWKEDVRTPIKRSNDAINIKSKEPSLPEILVPKKSSASLIAVPSTKMNACRVALSEGNQSGFSHESGHLNMDTASLRKTNQSCQTVSIPTLNRELQTTNKNLPPKKTVNKLVKCDICGFGFDDVSILAIHNQIVHSVVSGRDSPSLLKGSKQDRQFPCHLCSKAFKMRGSLMVHLRVAHSNVIAAGKSFLGKVDPENHSEERKFACHLCSKSFKKEQHLSQHLKTHEGKQWECDVCSKMFTTKYFLKKHKRLHTGETPYCCDTCGKTFTFQQSYHKHLLYHSDDKPHVCTECDRAFKELSTLHNHQRIHTGEKPFACETCGKCFRQRVSYLVHRRIHTGAMPYQCTACGKNFRYKMILLKSRQKEMKAEKEHNCNEIPTELDQFERSIGILKISNQNQVPVSQRTHKCPSQPPGTVVRQPGELVQKLLQGAAISSQVEPDQTKMDSKVRNNSLDNKTSNNNVQSKMRSNPESSSSSTLHKLPYASSAFSSLQQQQNLNSQFTIIVGTDLRPIFPTGQVLVAPSSVYDMPSATNSNESMEGNQLMNSKIQLSCRGSETITGDPVNLENRSSEDPKNTEQKNYNIPIISNKVSSNLPGSGRVPVQRISSNKRTDILDANKQSSQESETYNDNSFEKSPSTNCSLSNSTLGEIWKFSNKKQKSNDNSDLVVETTDFFTMVMSPSGKSLPSPSEKLKHLTISSTTDNLIGYEDEGIYHFLINGEDAGSLSLPTDAQQKETDSTINNALPPKNQMVTQNFNNTNNGTINETEPLETINEESLKQLLYGSART